MIDALVAVRHVEWPSDPLCGITNYSVGLISGGVAPNVIAPMASAELMFRTVGHHRDVRALLTAAVGSLATVEDVLVVPLVKLHTVPGFDSAVFAFATDVPFLDAWGKPLLFGPGSITVAHTDVEHIEVADLFKAAESYSLLIEVLK